MPRPIYMLQFSGPADILGYYTCTSSSQQPLPVLQGDADVKMEDAATEGDAAAITDAAIKQEDPAAEPADGAAAAALKEEAEEAAPAGKPGRLSSGGGFPYGLSMRRARAAALALTCNSMSFELVPGTLGIVWLVWHNALNANRPRNDLPSRIGSTCKHPSSAMFLEERACCCLSRQEGGGWQAQGAGQEGSCQDAASAYHTRHPRQGGSRPYEIPDGWLRTRHMPAGLVATIFRGLLVWCQRQRNCYC